MDKEKIAQLVKTSREERELYHKRREEIVNEVNKLCLQILEEKFGIKVGSEFFRKSDSFFHPDVYFKITRIDPQVYFEQDQEIVIQYSLRGTPKKKDGTYLKRAIHIKEIYIQ